MEIVKLEILRAIAGMAYVMALADRGLSAEERIAFAKIVEEELSPQSWAAQSRFEILDEVIQPDLESAYKEAIHEFRKYKDYLTSDIKQKSVRVMKRVADSCSGFSEKESLILDRFKKDIELL